MRQMDAIDFGGSKRFLVSGGTGFIGTALCHLLLEQGHVVTVLTRQGGKAAARFGNAVAALSVTRFGTAPSMPTAREITRFLKKTAHR